MAKKDNRMEGLLESILDDRRHGFNHPYVEYLVLLEPFTDEAEKERAKDRIHKTVSRNRLKINEAERQYLISQTSKVPEHKKSKEKEDTSIEEYFDYAKQGQEINKRIDDYNYVIEEEFDEPVCIVVSSDEHLGSTGCDYDKVMEDFSFMLDNDVKLIFNGDMGEQKREFPKNLFSVLSQVLSPSQQEDFITKLLLRLKENIICSVEGNHGSNARSGNEHSMKRCCREAGIQHHEGAALVKINIDGAEYRIFCRHKPLSMSKLSPLIGIRKMASLEKADIYIGSHLHRPTYGVDWPMGETRICILTGTYNTDAIYSKVGYGETSARAEFPCLLLFPKSKKMMVFASMRDAVAFRDMKIEEGM